MDENVHTFVRGCSQLYAGFFRFCVHVLCTKIRGTSRGPMATFNKLPSGCWRAQVRRRTKHVSKTFRLKSDAEVWALELERSVQTGVSPTANKMDPKALFSSLIDLHITDLAEVGKPLLRGKALCLENLRRDLGSERLVDLTRERLIRFGKDRAREGAGPVTVGIDIGYIKTLLVHAAAVHGVTVPTEQVSLARVALRRLGLVGKGTERDRRPTEDELQRIIYYNDNNPRQGIPVGRLVKFAIATAMRQSEICALRWSDIDFRTSLATVRNRKDPRRKSGNHQQVPLLDATGYDSVALLREQKALGLPSEFVFPYNGRSLGSAFRRTCVELGIDDLHFHDLRHEGTSRLFEAGFNIPEVSLVTGHKDWKMLRRYLNLRPHQLVGRKLTSRKTSI